MKNKKWIALAAAVILAVTALPMTAFAAEKDGGEEKLTKVTLNEVAHSIFYAPQYVAIEEGYFSEEGLDLTLITGFGADKVLTALISGKFIRIFPVCVIMNIQRKSHSTLLNREITKIWQRPDMLMISRSQTIMQSYPQARA